VVEFKLEYDVYLFNIPKNSEIEVWVPLPFDNEEQKILKEEIRTSSGEVKVTKEPKYGNRILYLRDKDENEVRMRLKYEIRRNESKGFLSREKNIEIFLGPSSLIPVNDSTLGIARKAVKDYKNETNLKIAKELYYFVLGYMNYDKSGKGWGRGDFWYACNSRKGNCTDFHSFFIGLARSLKVPAFFEIGFPIPRKEEKGEIRGYHCWAYFYYEGKWIPVDISEADKHPELKNYYFGTLDPYRVGFTRGRDIILEPPQKGKPLNYFIFPYAEVNGKKFENLEFSIYFEMLR